MFYPFATRPISLLRSLAPPKSPPAWKRGVIAPLPEATIMWRFNVLTFDHGRNISTVPLSASPASAT